MENNQFPQAKPQIFDFYPSKAPYRQKPLGIVSIPHGGLVIPEEFSDYIKGERRDLYCDVDFATKRCVDIEKLQSSGICVVSANICRIAIDLNRAPDKFLFAWKENTRQKQIVFKQPSEEFTAYCQKAYYTPYFFFIEQIMSNHPIQGIPFIDLHSMPSQATAYHMKQNPKQKKMRPEFCLSDFHGKSCEKNFIDHLSELLTKQSYDVQINDPYVGGHITQHFSSLPSPNLQLEINRKLYMDEEKIETIEEKIEKLSQDLTSSIIKLFESCSPAKIESE